MRHLPKKRLLKIFDQLRTMLAEGRDPKQIEAFLDRQHGIAPLKRCPGSAHDNPHIDHCLVCAPRWGWIEATVEKKAEPPK